MILEASLAAVALVLLTALWISHRRQARAIRPPARRPPRVSYPSLTVIRPIKGLDAGLAENLEAALDHGYPGAVETLFVFDDRREPALPLVEAALSKVGHSAGRVVFAGQPPANRTGKLNAMIVGLREARGELVVFADSDIRPDRQALRELVDTLLDDPHAGAAFAPVVATRPARTFGDAGYGLLLNGLYGPAAAAAASRRQGTLPFIMGQFMIFRREALRAIGGLECAEGQLVDDMYLGSRIAAAGYHNKVARYPVPVIQEGMAGAAFLATFRRWITFSRSGLPGRDFKLAGWLTGATYWAGLLGACAALALGLPLGAALLALAPVGVSASLNRLHTRLGGASLGWRHLWVSFAVLLMAPLIYLSILGRREVTWRGRRYQLDAGSRLVPITA
jgi:ceramide glucosyltransferase